MLQQQKILSDVVRFSKNKVDTTYRQQLKTESKTAREKKLKTIQIKQDIEKQEKMSKMFEQKLELREKMSEQKLDNEIKFIMVDIRNRINIFIELKESFSNIKTLIVPFIPINIEQKENTSEQKRIVNEIKKLTSSLIELMVRLDINKPLFVEVNSFIVELKNFSVQYALGLTEVYDYLGEEINEKSGISYDLLNAIQSRVPWVLTKRRVDTITSIIPPAEKIDTTAVGLTALSLLPIFRIRGLKTNIGRTYSLLKQKLVEKKILTKPRGRSTAVPEYEKMGIEKKGASKAYLVGALAFNTYLYGNLVEKNFKPKQYSRYLDERDENVEEYGVVDEYGVNEYGGDEYCGDEYCSE